MILFTVLALVAIFLLVIAVLIVSIGGAAFMAIFADVIVCVVLIGIVIKVIFFRK